MAVGTTAFPTALDTAVELVELTNNASSLLSANVLVGATTITVDDPSEFPTTGFATLVDDLTTPTKIEIISWTGKSGSDLTGVLKGRQGSSDQAWSLGDNIEIRPTKGMHEALRGAIIAIETKLGYGASTPSANTVLLGNGVGTSAFGAITNAYIDASAAIAHSKMAALTSSRLMATDASGFSSVTSVTSTEAGYLSGVTSAIQTQLDAKQASDATLTALAAYNTAGLITQTAADTFTGRTITGTTDVITVTNGNGVSGNPTITIAATYVGQNTITTLGTVTTGTLSTGAIIGGVTLTLGTDGTGDTYYRSVGGVLTRLAIGSEGQVLTVSAGGLPTWSAVAGTGDVVGPASATDNAVVRFDLTTGKLVQDSVVTIADTTGNMAGVGTLNTHTIPGGTDTFALLAASQTFTNKVLTAPDINGGTADALTSLGIRSTGSGAFDLTFANTENLAAGRTLTLKVNDADRTIDIAGNITTAAAFITSGANSLTLTTTGATNVTLPTTGTLAIVGGTLAQFAATTSAQLAGVISDETGSGALVFGTAPTFASTITIGTAGGTTGAINLLGTTSGTVTLKVADAAGTYTLTLPTTDGDASQFLQTDGAGVLSWATGGGGLTVGTTAIASGTAGRILYETSGNVLGEIAGSSVDSDGAVQFAASARGSGSAQYFRINTPADTALAADTESVGVYIGGDGSGATVNRTFADGTITTQREYVFVAPTYTLTNVTRTITTAATVAITAAPVAGASTTLTNPLALWVQSGVSRFPDAGIQIGSSSVAFEVVSSSLRVTSNGVAGWRQNVSSINYISGMSLSWSSSGTNPYVAADIGLARAAAGVLRLTDASTGAGKLVIGSSSASTSTADLFVVGSSASLVPFQVDTASTPTTDIARFTNNGTVKYAFYSDADESKLTQTGASGATNLTGMIEENLTLSTGGATTDTSIQIPANSFVLSVSYRITTTIAGVDSTDIQLGDATTATRFRSGASALTSGTTGVGLNQLQGGVATDATGPIATSATTIRVTLSGGADNTPTSGAIRITIHYITLTAATS